SSIFFSLLLYPPLSTLFPYTTLFRAIYSAAFFCPGSPVFLPSNSSDARISKCFLKSFTVISSAYVCEMLIVEFCCFCPNTFIERSEEHTSELQSRENLVCRLLLEKKK